MIAELDTRTLSNTPQRWGVLPSFRFWRRMGRELSQKTLWTFHVLGTLEGLLLSYVILIWLDVSFWTEQALLVGAAGFVILQTGLLERWLRKKVEQRALEATTEDEPLSPQHALAEGQPAALESASVSNPSPSGSAT